MRLKQLPMLTQLVAEYWRCRIIYESPNYPELGIVMAGLAGTFLGSHVLHGTGQTKHTHHRVHKT